MLEGAKARDGAANQEPEVFQSRWRIALRPGSVRMLDLGDSVETVIDREQELLVFLDHGKKRFRTRPCSGGSPTWIESTPTANASRRSRVGLDRERRLAVAHRAPCRESGASSAVGLPSPPHRVDLTAGGLPGCFLYPDPNGLLVIPTTPYSGAARLTLSIPSQPAMAGQRFELQGLQLEFAAVSTSNVGRTTVH